MSDAAKCEKCSATTVQHCDENNCGYLGAGNGAPEPPPYDGVLSHPLDRSDPELAVWYGKMPESNGKSNWTAILYRKGGEGSFMGRLSEGITIDRSEYEDRVRYEADRMRYLIGELDQEPDILAYDENLHSGYVKPTPDIPQQTVQQLRDSGHLVVIWTPEEIGTANESHLEDLVVQRGNEYLEDFQEAL